MSEATTREPARRADAQRNREALLSAARTLLAERGLAVQVDELATAAGVGVATLYRNFDSREDLIRAVLEDHTRAMIARLREAISGLAPDRALEAAVHEVAAHLADFRDLIDVAVRFRRTERSAPVLDEFLEELGGVLARAQADGSARLDVTLDDLSGLVLGIGLAPADPEGRARMCEVVLAGLRAGARSGRR
jgi:AcrR family transcriptional regulator